MALKQIVYSSEPFGYDPATLINLLLTARNRNSCDGLTGALICRDDIYLQLLEGPADKVDAAYARIKRDNRHVNVKTHVSTEVSERMFAGWDMLHDPGIPLLWSEEEILVGVLARATADEVLEVFRALAICADVPGARRRPLT